MLLRTVILVAVGFLAVTASPTPKIDSSELTNFLQSDTVKISRNSYIPNEVTGRSEDSLEAKVEEYIKSHDAEFSIPLVGSTLKLDASNLDNEELNFKLRFNSGSEVQARKKHKLKKIFAPILVFILIKAMTLIPLALGVLGIKTWNAIQLSFISFVTALGMAVWKLCGKIAGDHHHHPQIIHSAGWEHADYVARSDVVNAQAQQMAYSSSLPPQ